MSSSHQRREESRGGEDVVIVTDETKSGGVKNERPEQSLMTTFAQIDCSNGSPR